MTKAFEKICMVGLGYIGLPTAVVFALRSVNVVGLDVNPVAVESINRGVSHIVEPGLNDALRRVVAGGKLRATTTPEPADAFLIAFRATGLENAVARPAARRSLTRRLPPCQDIDRASPARSSRVDRSPSQTRRVWCAEPRSHR